MTPDKNDATAPGDRRRFREIALLLGLLAAAAILTLVTPWRTVEADGSVGESLGHAPLYSPPGVPEDRPAGSGGYAVRRPGANAQVDTPRLLTYLVLVGVATAAVIRGARGH